MNIKKRSKKRALIPILEKKIGPLTFGMYLRVSREQMELSQVEMAKKMGLARGTLCDIEKGRQLVSPELAIKIARIVGLSELVAIKACFQDQLNKLNMDLRIDITAA